MAIKVIWITGNSGAGKTTLAKHLLECTNEKIIWLDGDMVRGIWPGLTFLKDDRIENNLRVARLCKELVDQGFKVIVSTICPYRSLRNEIRTILSNNVYFIYLDGGKQPSEKYPYESRGLIIDNIETNGDLI